MINEDAELALAYLFDPAFEFTNTAGKPLTGGYIELYVHGTRNKYYAYSDWNGTLHPFQIPLDGLGANIVLVSPQFTYDAYIYSKYGTLQMSRYNVSPVGVGEVSVSGINTITSSDGTVEVSQYGDTFDLSVPDITAVSGLVEDVSELTSAVSGLTEGVTELTSAVSGLSEDIEDINTTVSGLADDVEELTTAVSSIQVDYVTEEELGSAISAVSAMVPAPQVNSDWDAVSGVAEILNKPDLTVYVTHDEMATAVSALSVQADWDENDPSSPAYIQNKPDLSVYATVSELESVSGNIVELIPDVSDFTTKSEVNEAIVSAIDLVTGIIPEAQVQSDWDEDDPSSKAYILNKPDMADYVTEDELASAISAVSAMVPEAQVQSDWDEDDPSSKAYILNKPEEKDLVAGDGIEITVSGTSVIISSDNPSVSGYATEVELAAVSGTLQLEIETVSSNPRVKTVEYGVDEWSDVVSAMDGVSSGKYDYVVMKYSANGTDLYAPLVKYTPGSAAYFVCPAHGTATTYGYGTRRTTEVYTINSGDMWFDYTVRPFQGRLIGAGNVSVTVDGEDYIVSGTGGTFEQVNADWNATSGVAEILNKPETVEIETVGVSAGSGIAITEVASGIVISCTVTGSSFEQVNSDWNAVSGVAEILNKPETVEIETVAVSAGSGIDITDGVISVDNTVALKTDIPTYTAGQGISVSGGVISVLYTTIDFTGTITCPTCNGTGSVTSTDSCPTCGGTGGYESYETCSVCNGSGTVSCSTCNGSGHTGEQCSTCGGIGTGGPGTVVCESCGGEGCEACDYNGYVTCMDCQGTGYVMCPTCNGAGEYSCGSCGGTGGYSSYNTCSECDGTGTIELHGICSTCSGTGQIEE